jgi:UDP-2-acetamido-2,6-beta-L-arabino-hexul-4-ose reductase
LEKILITGAHGFIGKNLTASLTALGGYELYLFDKDTPAGELDKFCADCGFIFHLAGINRPKDDEKFSENHTFLEDVLSLLKKHGNRCPILLSSSTQAALDNEYGGSKKNAEELLAQYGKDNGVATYIYRLPNVFGKWSRPNYNSGVATFCHNIARGLPITVSNRDNPLNLVYIDDVVAEFISALGGKASGTVSPVHSAKLGEVVDIIESFGSGRKALRIADMGCALTKELYATYLSFLPPDDFSYGLKVNTDSRGSFTELLKHPSAGQVSLNVSKAGIVKGNHWHNTKNEKFIVISGQAIIRFRKIGEADIIEYKVSGDEPKVVDIPPGYTHNIENIGSCDLLTIMWANESFNPAVPDTVFEEV